MNSTQSFYLPTPNYPIPQYDLVSHFKTLAYAQHCESWKLKSNRFLFKIKPKPQMWKTLNHPNRRAEINLARLRIGHTRISHIHLITKKNPHHSTIPARNRSPSNTCFWTVQSTRENAQLVIFRKRWRESSKMITTVSEM